MFEDDCILFDSDEDYPDNAPGSQTTSSNALPAPGPAPNVAPAPANAQADPPLEGNSRAESTKGRIDKFRSITPVAGSTSTHAQASSHVPLSAHQTAIWRPIQSSAGDWYWFDTTTGQTTWQTPAGLDPIPIEGPQQTESMPASKRKRQTESDSRAQTESSKASGQKRSRTQDQQTGDPGARGRNSNVDGQVPSTGNGEDDPHRLNITIRGAAERQANDDPGDLDLSNRPVISIRGASTNDDSAEVGRPVISIRGASNPQVSPQALPARPSQATIDSSPRVLPRKNASRQEPKGAPGPRSSDNYHTSPVDSRQQQDSSGVDRTEQAQGGGQQQHGQHMYSTQKMPPLGPADPHHVHIHGQSDESSHAANNDRYSLRSRLEPPRNRNESTSSRKPSSTERQTSNSSRGPKGNQSHKSWPADMATLPTRPQSDWHNAMHSKPEPGPPNWQNAPLPRNDPGPPPAMPDPLRAPHDNGWDSKDHSRRTLNGQLSDSNSAPTSSSRWPASQALDPEVPPAPRQASSNFDGTGANQKPLAVARTWGNSNSTVPDIDAGPSGPAQHVIERAAQPGTTTSAAAAAAASFQHVDSTSSGDASRTTSVPRTATGDSNARNGTRETLSKARHEGAGTSRALTTASHSDAAALTPPAAIAEPIPSAPLTANEAVPILPAPSAVAEVTPRQSLPKKKKKHSDIWNPSHLFVPEDFEPLYSLVVLNQPIAAAHRHMFQQLWARATLRICADGAANAIFDAFREEGFQDEPMEGAVEFPSPEVTQLLPPNEIVGDLDSVRDAVKEYFEKRGTRIVERPSQYATDLQKSIRRLEDAEAEQASKGDLVIFGGLSGRFDQTTHTLHVMWQLAKGVPDLKGVVDPENEAGDGNLVKRSRTWVVNEASVTWLLPPGKHDLQMSRRVLGKTCGILPLGVGPQNDGARVTTKGLKWNLTASTGTHLGGLVSTSNHLNNDDGMVQIECDEPIYWTVELKTDEEIARRHSAQD